MPKTSSTSTARRSASPRPRSPTAVPPVFYEAETVGGLEAFAADELTRLGADAANPKVGAGAVRFSYADTPDAFESLRTVGAVYRLLAFAVPRPRALLGDEHLRRIVGGIREIVARFAPGMFTTLHLSAAGADSSVMVRLKTELTHAVGLRLDEERGDLWLRVRPGRDGGWEVLIRLTPRPLATRVWRVCNYEAALNATVAWVMNLLTQPRPDDVYVNLMCGSGSLLIERAAWGGAAALLGVDLAPDVLACAHENLAAWQSGTHAVLPRQGTLWRTDVRRLPLPAASVTALTVDLPFGQNVGSHASNQALYPAVFAEAARVARPGARLVALTHEIRLMEALASTLRTDWQPEAEYRITLRGLHPRVYVLSRRSG